MAAAGEGPGGSGEVECDDGEDEPGGVGVEFSGGQVGEGGALEASKACSMMAWPRWVLSASTVSIWSVVRIRWQATTEAQVKQLPKSNKLRDIAIPQAAPAGFRLDRWLAARVPKALEEQARGVNPRALIFPNPSGGLFGEQNLRNRVWAPAAEELGWAMDEDVTALGKKRRLFRFTLRALRDCYANTAIHEWQYPEDVLLQQGSWEDAETVRRFYAGVTDESQSVAMLIHGWQARPGARLAQVVHRFAWL